MPDPTAAASHTNYLAAIGVDLAPWQRTLTGRIIRRRDMVVPRVRRTTWRTS